MRRRLSKKDQAWIVEIARAKGYRRGAPAPGLTGSTVLWFFCADLSEALRTLIPPNRRQYAQRVLGSWRRADRQRRVRRRQRRAQGRRRRNKSE
jgi:hypothetical protein